MATAGDDFSPYRDRMVAKGIDARLIKVVDGTFTAQAFITTDMTTTRSRFHPAQCNMLISIKYRTPGRIALGIVAPEGGRL